VWETRGNGFLRNLLRKISIIHVWQTRGNGFLEVSWWGRFPQPILPESSLLSVVDVGAAVQLGSNPIQSVYKHDEERRLTWEPFFPQTWHDSSFIITKLKRQSGSWAGKFNSSVRAQDPVLRVLQLMIGKC
jgi:hypothetical protein